MTYKRQMAKAPESLGPWDVPGRGGDCTPLFHAGGQGQEVCPPTETPLLTQGQPLRNASPRWGCPPVPAPACHFGLKHCCILSLAKGVPGAIKIPSRLPSVSGH